MSKSIYKTFSSYKSYILAHKQSKKLIFQSDGRNHYVYRITNIKNNKHYYGSRISILDPLNDLGLIYFSSSSNKDFISEQKKYPIKFKYKIIKIYDNHIDALIYESYLHQYFQVKENNTFINHIQQSVYGFGTLSSEFLSESQTGANNSSCVGYYIYKNKTYNTAIEMAADINMSADQIRRCCKNLDKVISSTAYRFNKFLPTVGKKDKIVGKTYKQIGFNFEYFKIIEKFDKRIGIHNSKYIGYYCYKNIKFPTSRELSSNLNIGYKLIQNYCKNPHKIITLKSYIRVPFLQNIGTHDDIVGKTYGDIGFHFIYEVKNNINMV